MPSLRIFDRKNKFLFFLYGKFVLIMKKYRKNKYFFRTFNTILSGFLTPNLDVNLIVNIIVLELKNLRKQHKIYIKFVRMLLLKFFIVFKYRHVLAGFIFSVKGRLILYNRETRRSVKLITRYGSISKANMRTRLCGYQANTSARYGAMYISLYFSLVNTHDNSIFFNPPSDTADLRNDINPRIHDIRRKNYQHTLFFDRNYNYKVSSNIINFFKLHLYNTNTANQNIFFYLYGQFFNSYTRLSFMHIKTSRGGIYKQPQLWKYVFFITPFIEMTKRRNLFFKKMYKNYFWFRGKVITQSSYILYKLVFYIRNLLRPLNQRLNRLHGASFIKNLFTYNKYNVHSVYKGILKFSRQFLNMHIVNFKKYYKKKK
jgi:hypothetical protein